MNLDRCIERILELVRKTLDTKVHTVAELSTISCWAWNFWTSFIRLPPSNRPN